MLSIDVTTGNTVSLGTLPAAGGLVGQSPGDLTFDPTLTDPFTSQTGALVGVDTATHQLFFVSVQNRGGVGSGNYLYAVYVSQADFTSSIVISGVTIVKTGPSP